MKIKIAEATPSQLNWLVAVYEGEGTPYIGPDGKQKLATASYTTDWGFAGEIIEREEIGHARIPTKAGELREYCAWKYRDEQVTKPTKYSHGPTQLMAIMRCHLTSLLGDEAEVPEELT